MTKRGNENLLNLDDKNDQNLIERNSIAHPTQKVSEEFIRKTLGSFIVKNKEVKHIISAVNQETEPTSKILVQIISTIVPLMIIGVLFQFSTIMDYKWAGDLDDINSTSIITAAYGMGALLLQVTGYIFGDLSVGLETLISQAYGQQNYKRLAALSIVCIFMLICFSPVVMVLWLLAQQWVPWVVRDIQEVNLISQFLLFCCIGIIPYFIFRSWFAVSITTKTFAPLLLACVLNCITYPFLSYYIVFTLDMGIKGLSLAIGMSSFILGGVMVGSSFLFKSLREAFVLSPCGDTFKMSYVKEILRLGVPSVLMTLLNFMFWQKSQLIMEKIVGQFNTQDAHLVLLNISTVINTSGISIYTAVSFPLGIALGKGSYKNAKKISKLALIAASCIGTIIGICIYFCRSPLAKFYNKNPLIISEVESHMWYVSINAACLYVAAGLNATYVASGWQLKVVIVQLIAGYLIGIPLDIILTTKDGLTGIWMSTTLEMLLRVTMLLTMYLFFLDFEQISVLAVYRSMDKTNLDESNLSRKSLMDSSVLDDIRSRASSVFLN